MRFIDISRGIGIENRGIGIGKYKRKYCLCEGQGIYEKPASL